MITSRAPVRIDFGGGGTDVEPYTTDYGGVVINATIDKFASCSSRTRDKCHIIQASDFYELIKGVVSFLSPSVFYSLRVSCDAPVRAGLGASASVCSSVIHSLNDCLSKPELAELAFTIEHDFLGNAGGRQDQYASVFGGFNIIEFHGGSDVNVIKFPMSRSFIKYLESNLVLFYTGSPHTSGNLVSRQVADYSKIVNDLHEVKRNAYSIIDSLKGEDFESLARNLTCDNDFKVKLNPFITTPYISSLLDSLSNHGVIGGRICGAGGGGCVVLACDDAGSVRDYLKDKQGSVIPFKFESEGLKVEHL